MFCLPCFAVQLILVFSKERKCSLGLSEQTKGICRDRSADVTCKTRETIPYIRIAVVLLLVVVMVMFCRV